MAVLDYTSSVDTIMSLLQDQEAAFNTLIYHYHVSPHQRITFFDYLQSAAHLATSNTPAIEVAITGGTPSWHAPRVQERVVTCEIHITTPNSKPSISWRLNTKMVSLVERILTRPYAILSQIGETTAHYYDSTLPTAQITSNQEGKLITSVLNWEGKYLEFLADKEFGPLLGVPNSPIC